MYNKDQFPLVPNPKYIEKEKALHNALRLLFKLSIIYVRDGDSWTSFGYDEIAHGYVNRVTGLMFYIPEKELR